MILLTTCNKISILVSENNLENNKKHYIILYQQRQYYSDYRNFKQVDDPSKTLYPQLKEEYFENRATADAKFEELRAKYHPEKPEQKPQNLGDQLQTLMLKVLAEQSAEKVIEIATPLLEKHIKETYGSLPQIHEVKTPKAEYKFKGVVHEKFDDVLNLVNLDIPVFLTGPAGAGKNVICKQVAEALGLEFYFTNAVTQEYKLTGFIDANGVFQETQFYKAFKNGGLFMLDEMDASIPEVLIILNAAIANRYFDFPNGKIEAHPDFRVIAAGNTFGTGADIEYTGRYQLDAASLDRFALVEINYSEAIENAIAQNDTDLLNFVRGFRKATIEAGIRHLCTYRTIERIAKLSNAEYSFSADDVLRMSLYKGLKTDDLNIIINKLEEYGLSNNVWVKASK